MKYYRLCPQYKLRGWIGLPYALVNEEGAVRLSGEEFNALLTCDGMTNTGAIKSGKLLDSLRSLEQKGYICASASPKKINREQHYKHYDNPYIREVKWPAAERRDAAMGEMTQEEAIGMIDRMAKCGIYHLVISGGEPLEREDFWTIADHAMEKGIRIDRIHTNGRMINHFMLDRFEERGMKPEFCVSFDGVDWYDWIMGAGGAEQAGLNALRYCYLRGFPTSVEMSVHRGEADQAILREVIDVLADSGVGTIRFRDGKARAACEAVVDAG